MDRLTLRPLLSVRLAVLAVWLFSCGSGSPKPLGPVRAGGAEGSPERRFRAERAWRDLSALFELAADASQSSDRKRSRYLRKELERAGVAVSELGGASGAPAVHLLGRLPGTGSTDAFLLTASYRDPSETREAGSCEAALAGGSGTVLLLELARALSVSPLPYATWLAFTDETQDAGIEGSDEGSSGSDTLLETLREEGSLESIRFALFVGRVAEPGLRVLRDLHSHRAFRERFFRVAQRLGRQETFPADGRFTSVQTGHRAFLQAGIRRVVALVGETGGQAPKTENAGADLSRCSSASLQAVGEVILEGLGDVAALLRKVDRFTRQPADPAKVSDSR